MKRGVLFFLLGSLITLASVVAAQQQAKDQPKKSAPMVTALTALKIRELQLKDANLSLEMQKLVTQYEELKWKQQQLQAEIQQKKIEALKEAGLDPDKYLLDDEMRVIEKPAKPGDPSPPPTPK